MTEERIILSTLIIKKNLFLNNIIQSISMHFQCFPIFCIFFFIVTAEEILFTKSNDMIFVESLVMMPSLE